MHFLNFGDVCIGGFVKLSDSSIIDNSLLIKTPIVACKSLLLLWGIIRLTNPATLSNNACAVNINNYVNDSTMPFGHQRAEKIFDICLI